MTFKEQAVGGDNPELVLEWRHAPIGPVLLVDKHITASATHVCLELRWHPVRRGLDHATHFEVRRRDFQSLRPRGSDPGRRRGGRAGQDHAAAQKPASRLRLGGTRVYDVVSCRPAARPWASRHLRLLHDGVLPASRGTVCCRVHAKRLRGDRRPPALRDAMLLLPGCLASVRTGKPIAGEQKPPNKIRPMSQESKTITTWRNGAGACWRNQYSREFVATYDEEQPRQHGIRRSMSPMAPFPQSVFR